MGITVSQQQPLTTHTNTCTRLVQVMSASNVNRKEGELLKYKNVFAGWGKRYFRLERTYLHYFETKHVGHSQFSVVTHAPIATVTRGEIGEVKPSTAFPGRINVFEIIHKSGLVWYCQASSAEEMVSWLQSLSPVPIMLDSSQYPMIDNESFVEVPAANNPGQVQPSPIPPSPYRDLMEQAHHTAHTCNTQHECQHYSPPPPYSADGNRPPFEPPPNYQAPSTYR